MFSILTLRTSHQHSKPSRSRNRAGSYTIGEHHEPGSIPGPARHGKGTGPAWSQGGAHHLGSSNHAAAGDRLSLVVIHYATRLGNRPKTTGKQDPLPALRRRRCIGPAAGPHTLTAHPACSTTCSNTSSLSRQATPIRRVGSANRQFD